MRLQGVSAKDRGNLIERELIEGLPVSDRGENVFCHLRHNQVLDEEYFLKFKRGRDAVVQRNPLEQFLGKVIVQVIEGATNPHFHRTIQIDICRREWDRSCDSNLAPVVSCSPLSDR